MRLAVCSTLLFFLVSFAFAWTKDDHEIFDLVSALEAAEGKGTTFYSWLNVSPTATTTDISKAYRKLSMRLHPDKNPGVKGVHERFARLSVIGKILREDESRARYDFFFKNGVPRWRGTGYYYSRFRPGLGSVLVFLVILTSALQHIVQRLNYKRDIARIEHICREARVAAWGPKLVPLGNRRKVRISLGGPPRLDDDGNVVLGKTLDMVVESDGEVYIVEEDGDLTQLDTSHATLPAISRTWAIVLAVRAYTHLRSKFLPDSADGSDTSTDSSPLVTEGNAATNADHSDGPGTTEEKKVDGGKTSGRRKKTARRRA